MDILRSYCLPVDLCLVMRNVNPMYLVASQALCRPFASGNQKGKKC